MTRRSPLRSIVVLMAVLLGCCSRAQAWFVFPSRVFDAQRFAQQVHAIRYEIQWIESVARHLENDTRMLRHLDYSNVGSWTTGLQRIESVVARIDALRNEPNRIAQHIEENWPIHWSGAAHERAHSTSVRDAWLARERAALADCRAVQNGVVTEMSAVKSRVSDWVERSNAADGTTATLQARTQLNAELSGELAKLQALRVSRAALRNERVASDQSESARAIAVRDWLMRSKGTSPPPEGRGTHLVEFVPDQ